MTFLLSLLGALVAVSLVEYFGHRSVLHEGRLSLGKDHITHHKYFARDFLAGGEEVAFYDQYWVRFAFGLVWPLPVALPLLFLIGWVPAAVLVATAGLHAVLWQRLHNEMHRPKTGWLQRTAYFRFIRDFHLVHHLKSRTNYAFVFAPLWDRVFGTYRRL
mgnify:CR=1 FL=1